MANNVLRFYLEMKDLMSSGLAKVAKLGKEGMGQVDQAVKRVQTSIDNTRKRNDVLGMSFDSLKRKAQDLESVIRKSTSVSQIRAARQELALLNRQMRGHAGNIDGAGGMGGGMMGGLLRRFAPAAIAGMMVAAAVPFAKSSAQAYINYEKTNKSFEVLAGNRGIGSTLTSELNKLQQDTILGPEVFKNAQTMMGFGITAEKVIPHLKMLGEVSMGDADRLQRLTLAFSQVQAAGKLMGQDLLQFVNAGFNPLKTISEQTGKSIGVLRKEMEDGKISADMVTRAFQAATGKGGLFNGMLDQMATTTGGKMAQLEGQFESLKIAAGERFAPAVGKSVEALSKLVLWAKKVVEIPVEKKLQDEIDKIRGLHAELTAANTSHQRRVELLQQLEQINPNIVAGIDKENIAYGKLAENINAVTSALQQKIFLERFNKDNVDTITRFAEAQEKQRTNFANVLTTVARVDAAMAQRTDLTLGQKQMMAIQELERRVNMDPNKGKRLVTGDDGASRYVTTPEYDMLNQLRGFIQLNNQAVNTIKQLTPEINSINKTRDALSAQINGVLGVKSMSAAQIQGGGGKGAGGTTGGTTEAVGRAVASGGPRNINIYGVKFTDKIEIHAVSTDKALEDLEDRLQELTLRILNSGASVQ